MSIIIRGEMVSDYTHITNVNYEAFLGWHPDNQYVSEPLIVDLLRHNSMFDPDLSLVAEVDGKIVGHALFSPYKFIVFGKEQEGIVLGPIAVHPKYQRMGVGRMLMEEGHYRASQKRYSFSLLCGHPEYYPKFGYKTRMFSVSGCKLDLDVKEFINEDFGERPVNEKDILRITETWKRLHGNDNLALFNGTNISEWSNHGLKCYCNIVLRQGKPIGYVRYVNKKSICIKELLADVDDFSDILCYLALKHYGTTHGEIKISLSKEVIDNMLKNNVGIKVTDKRTVNNAFMIKVLDKNSFINEYCIQIEKGNIMPGIIVFPPMLGDVDDGR